MENWIKGALLTHTHTHKHIHTHTHTHRARGPWATPAEATEPTTQLPSKPLLARAAAKQPAQAPSLTPHSSKQWTGVWRLDAAHLHTAHQWLQPLLLRPTTGSRHLASLPHTEVTVYTKAAVYTEATVYTEVTLNTEVTL